MEYKVGDKLLCKKDLYITFVKGKKYKIIHSYVNSGSHWIYVDGETGDNNETTNLAFWYGEMRSMPLGGKDYLLDICDYFYTKEEERKIKLEKLI